DPDACRQRERQEGDAGDEAGPHPGRSARTGRFAAACTDVFIRWNLAAAHCGSALFYRRYRLIARRRLGDFARAQSPASYFRTSQRSNLSKRKSLSRVACMKNGDAGAGQAPVPTSIGNLFAMRPDLAVCYGQERLPRYTSYPTTPHFSPAIAPGTYAE